MLAAPAAPAIAYPSPAPLPPVSATTLASRYAATHSAVREALAVAGAGADEPRVSALESLLDRNLLALDGRGTGRVVEVVGDLAGADRVEVLVPGCNTTMDTFDQNRGPGGGARALAGQITTIAPESRVAVVAWLGYDTPQGISLTAATDGLARAGVDALRTTVDEIGSVTGGRPVSLLCHSYGSVVCAYAAPGLPVADLAIYGSPGVGARTAADLATPARVWAGRATGDAIRLVPAVRLAGLGFGADPVAPGFGARPFPAGDGGHGDYHLRGGDALPSLALIALGRMEESHG
jgi:hypothetical protein